MKKAGQIVLFQFPQTDLEKGKLRPALLLGKLPGDYDDWLICMISSQTHQYVAGFDEIVKDSDEDFEQSGLKVSSVIRVGRLAVVSGDILLGAIGEISQERLSRVRRNLSNWLSEKQSGGLTRAST
jgi:mRNA interferase MazF